MHENKTELFGFLSLEVTHLPLSDDKGMYATHGSEVIYSPAKCDLTRLAPCLQEESESRLLIQSCCRCCAEEEQEGDYTHS